MQRSSANATSGAEKSADARPCVTLRFASPSAAGWQPAPWKLAMSEIRKFDLHATPKLIFPLFRHEIGMRKVDRARIALVAATAFVLTLQSLPAAADTECKLLLIEEWKVRWFNDHLVIDGGCCWVSIFCEGIACWSPIASARSTSRTSSRNLRPPMRRLPRNRRRARGTRTAAENPIAPGNSAQLPRPVNSAPPRAGASGLSTKII